MRTEYELGFEESITAMILSNERNSRRQMALLLDFHRNSSKYYDDLCDCLYSLAIGRATAPLWVTPGGQPYLSEQCRAGKDKEVLVSAEMPEFTDDLTEQLKTALASLQRLSNY